MIEIFTDCRHYRVDRPCGPHKRSAARCPTCTEFDPATKRVLVVKLGAMGDVLRTTATLPPLMAAHTGSHITWITREASRPLLEMNPFVDRILTVESNYVEFLLTETFDLALGPDADPLSAAIMRLATAVEKRGFVADGDHGVIATNSAAANWWKLGLDDGLKRANRRTYGE